jgi:two-component system, NtrC family, sensor kinase
MNACASRFAQRLIATEHVTPAEPVETQGDQALQESQERLQALFEGVETGIFIIDAETHTLVDANSIAARMVGLPREKIIGSSCDRFVCPAEAGRRPATDLEQAVDNSERVLLTADGQRLAIIKTVRPVVVSGRRHLLESFLDITELKAAETALKERTAYLHTLIDVTPLGVVVLDAEERVEMSNAAFERLFHYSQDEARGVLLNDLIVPAGFVEDALRLHRQCREQGSVQTNARRRRKDGTLVDVQIFGVGLKVDGKPHGFLALYEDITTRIQAEQSMAERIRLAALAASVGVAVTGSDNLHQGLQKCAEILAEHTDVALARVWTVNHAERMLELQASAGMYTRIDGAHARVPVGSLKIGQIAETGEPHLSNNVLEDSWVADPAWAQREGMVSFAGYPLKVKDRVLGVVAAFARRPLTDAALQAFAAVADSLAQFIERKRAEESLRASEDRFRTAFEDAPYGMCLTAPDGRFMHANAALCAMLGYSEEEMQAGAWQQLTHPGDMERSREASLGFSRGASHAVELEKRYIHKNGSLVWCRSKILAIRFTSGEISHFVAQIENITQRKQADEARAFLASIVESSPDAIIGSSVDGMVMSWNRGAEMLYGYKAEDVIGQPATMLVPAGRISELAQTLDAVGLKGQMRRYETARVRKDGTLVDVALTLSPVRDRTGKITGISTIAQDITERKRAEEELLFKTTLLESEAEITIDGILVVDGDGRRLQTNRRFAEIFDIPQALMEQNSDKLLLDHICNQTQDPAAFLERVQYLYTQEMEKSRDEIQLKDGRCIDRYTAPLHDAGGRYYGRVWYFRDISDRKRAEQALRENEQRYRELFENASEIIFTTDLDGRFTSLNRAGERVLGYTQEKVAKTDVWRAVGPEYGDVLRQGLARMLAGEAQFTLETEVVAKDGRRVRLEVKPRLIWHGEKPVGVQAIARDITGRDLAEMELRQTQKLESVGRLAAGIAHEINTPIQFVGDNTRFLEDSFASLKTLLGKFGELRDAASSGAVGPELLSELRRAEKESDCAYLIEEIPRAITQTMEGVDRVATLVRVMKEFAHPENREMAPADLNKALLSTMTVARNEWKYVAEVDTDFAELPLVVCNVGDLNQVVLNLLVNAAHAIADVLEGDGKGKITIRTAAEGDKVHISIADTGSGIPEGIRTKIFDPFFTTKEVGRGTGQGLAIARSVVVDRHKGTLTFESEVGKGTTFHIRLPIAPDGSSAETSRR